MGQPWKYAACLLALAACSEKHPATAGQPATGRPAAPSKPNGAAPAATAARAPARLQPVAVAAAEVPAAQRLPGKLLEAWRWQDTNGENLLVLYRTEIPARSERPAQAHPATGYSGEEEGRGAQLLVRQYVRKQGTYTELWRLQDGVYNCPVDLILGPAPHATTVTDLDHNGKSETTLLYARGCRGDVSADDFKLVMHEGAAKYALRGSNVVQFDSIPARQRQPANPCCLGQLTKAQLAALYEGPAAAYMGRYFSEADFKDKPEFLRFARRQWQQYSVADTTRAAAE